METQIKKRDLGDIWDEMKKCASSNNSEVAHDDADVLLCEAMMIATTNDRATPWLGERIVETFKNMTKGYG